MNNKILWLLSILAILIIFTQTTVIVNQQTEIYILEKQLSNKEIILQATLKSKATQHVHNRQPPPGKTFDDGHWDGDFWHDTSNQTNQRDNIEIINEFPEAQLNEKDIQEITLKINNYQAQIDAKEIIQEKYHVWDKIHEKVYTHAKTAQRQLHSEDVGGPTTESYQKYLNTLTEKEKIKLRDEIIKRLKNYEYTYTELNMINQINPYKKKKPNENDQSLNHHSYHNNR